MFVISSYENRLDEKERKRLQREKWRNYKVFEIKWK